METARAVQKGAIHLIASVIYSRGFPTRFIFALARKIMFFGAVNYTWPNSMQLNQYRGY